MTEAERLALFGSERVLMVTSNGPRGWPHSTPMWFVVREGELWIWTFAKSQKTRNLERDPRATLLIEAGESYEQLRGVMIEAEAELIGESMAVLELGLEIAARYRGSLDPDPDERSALEAQARKRVAIRFDAVRTMSWDHRKL
jgi:PPOX class probable F420-dependent enzyme